MKKVNPYTLYLSGVLSESQYLDIVEKEEINELNYKTYDSAASAMSDKIYDPKRVADLNSEKAKKATDDMKARYNKFYNAAEKRSLNIPMHIYVTREGRTQNFDIRINQIDIINSKGGFFSKSKPVGVSLSISEGHRNISYILGKEMYIDLKTKQINFSLPGQELNQEIQQAHFDRAGVFALVRAINQQAGAEIVNATFFKMADDSVKGSSSDINDTRRERRWG